MKRGRVAGVSNVAADGLLGLLHPMWQALIAVSLLVVTVLGLRRLAARGPARMTNALVVTGLLIVAITVVGTLAVSCESPSDRIAQTPGSRN
jgi:heme A synthase